VGKKGNVSDRGVHLARPKGLAKRGNPLPPVWGGVREGGGCLIHRGRKGPFASSWPHGGKREKGGASLLPGKKHPALQRGEKKGGGRRNRLT